MKLSLKSVDPSSSGKFKKKEDATESTRLNLEKMDKLLYQMFAENKHSLLIILQGIDASGKDGAIDHIFAGSNPQGIRVYSFKEPTPEELRHDFLWRCHKVTPEAGLTAIFNRSYYEEVTTLMVHPELLEKEHLPNSLLKRKDLFSLRYRQINDFERMLTENGTLILKFFLHISKDEQRTRLQERLDDPSKKWKFSIQDVKERKYFNTYLDVFEKMIEETHSRQAPWYIIPSDRKWYRNYLVSKHIVETLEGLKIKYPKPKEKIKKIK